jgi:hypothetical protein
MAAPKNRRSIEVNRCRRRNPQKLIKVKVMCWFLWVCFASSLLFDSLLIYLYSLWINCLKSYVFTLWPEWNTIFSLCKSVL